MLWPHRDSVIEAQVGRIPGPAQTSMTIPVDTDLDRAAIRPAFQRSGPSWKSAIIVGAIAGVVFGLTVAAQDGDEGSDRPFSDRLSDGLVAGAMLAVPVTVVFAMLSGD